ncbi:MAG: hypothetical protein MUE33_01290 [Cytophagaceae bacterium]|jgi:hypothetical protein|nr:hypothetical protein [Cytophagaceae bacterium]
MKNNSLKHIFNRQLAWTLIFVFLFNAFAPGVSYALTSGPSQPEVQSFEPVSTTEMVDLFTGDFTYNIPLFEVPGPNGGYPVNLHYNAGISMDQEASWVGLGWNINPGAINRQLQGLPDEYNNSNVNTQLDIEPSNTVSVGADVSVNLANIEIFGGDVGSDGNAIELTPSVGIGFALKYNNYRGLSYEIGPSFGITHQFSSGVSAGLGLNLSIDSELGSGFNLNAIASTPYEKTVGAVTTRGSHTFYMGIGYDANQGLNQFNHGYDAKKTELLARTTYKTNLMYSNTLNKVLVFNTPETHYSEVSNAKRAKSGSASLSVASIGYLPMSSSPMEMVYTAVSFKSGLSVLGVFKNLGLTGTFMHQYLPSSEQNKNVASCGYLYAQNSTTSSSLDFNRESDGPVHKNSPVLPIPIATPDIFSMTSHGVSTMFRAFRNDFGIYHDLDSRSTSVGFDGAVEVGPPTHGGVGLKFGYGENTVNKWTDDNRADEWLNFKNHSQDENYYFKTYGELNAKHKSTYESFGGENPMRINLDGHILKEELSNGNGLNIPFTDGTYRPLFSELNTTSREKRNTPVQYINPNNPSLGMYIINADGSRYTYGKAQNIKSNVESIFSIDGANLNYCTKTIDVISMNGNKPKYRGISGASYVDYFYKRTEMSEDYAYSYLITEIKGADYIDADGNGQVNDGDKGYWVKFNYTTPVSDYKWRSPFVGANYIPGKSTTLSDDRAQYSYGEKEIYYLESIETNSHIATFTTSNRKDARGAAQEYNSMNNATILGAASKKLECIELKSKLDPSNKLLKVFFEYSYDLCKGVLNNDASIDNYSYNPSKTIVNNKGKLTLKKVWIEYEKNKRGKMSPYIFDYKENQTSDNPNYINNNFDRWGMNRSTVQSTGIDCDNPYMPEGSTNRPLVDQAVSAWSLKGISLPSGAKISVDYEADDYAYVQNKKATRMFKISNVRDETNTDNKLEHDASKRIIYFNLENPIDQSANPTDDKAAFEKTYLDGNRQLYFRIYSSLVNDSRMDWVAGYAPIIDFGLGGIVNQKYTKGFVKLGNIKIGNKTFTNYHPMALASWQALMTDYPELKFSGNINYATNSSKSAKIAELKSFLKNVGPLFSMFLGFYTYCNTANYGQRIDLNRSFIRLNDPDQIKVGGGVRVKKIMISDQWQRMHTGTAEAEYGQVYEYTTLGKDGKRISSGVASYEPQIGGDENALKNVIDYVDKIPLKLSNRISVDLPVNESYFPAPSVGYSKVTVKSLASENHLNNGKTGEAYEGILTSGALINEFYTYKDFPIITGYTPVAYKKGILPIPVPFVGSWKDMEYTASQGFLIKLNDMHGKPKRISKYRQKRDGSIDFSAPESYVEIEYFATKIPNRNPENDAYELNCSIPVLVTENGVMKKSMDYRVGEHIEFFTDMREYKTNNTLGGANANLELLTAGIIFLPVPSIWPAFVHEESRVRLCVSNKIIHRFGSVKSITSYDGNSKIITKNEVYDAQTGQVVLTSVNNNFDDPIYTYSMPSFYVYESMKPAYETVGLKFDVIITNPATNNLSNEAKCLLLTNLQAGNKLMPGDMLRCVGLAGGNVYTGVVTRPMGNQVRIQFNANLPINAVLNCTVEMPGRRNLLNATAGSVSILKPLNDPTAKDPIEQLY